MLEISVLVDAGIILEPYELGWQCKLKFRYPVACAEASKMEHPIGIKIVVNGLSPWDRPITQPIESVSLGKEVTNVLVDDAVVPEAQEDATEYTIEYW